MTDDLEATLRAVGTRLDVPPASDPTRAVLARLEAPEPAPTGWRPVHRLVAAAVVALVALAAAMAVSPTVRAAVYDLLRIGDVEIHSSEPPPVPPPVEAPLPGEREVSLARARAVAAIPLKLPARLGPPDHVRLIDGTPPRVVSMAFGPVRIDQFDGGLDPTFAKYATASDVRSVTVGGVPGIWVDRPHVVLYLDRAGQRREASARLAASTLIWARDGITYRVEGDLTQTEAIAIAESLR